MTPPEIRIEIIPAYVHVGRPWQVLRTPPPVSFNELIAVIDGARPPDRLCRHETLFLARMGWSLRGGMVHVDVYPDHEELVAYVAPTIRIGLHLESPYHPFGAFDVFPPDPRPKSWWVVPRTRKRGRRFRPSWMPLHTRAGSRYVRWDDAAVARWEAIEAARSQLISHGSITVAWTLTPFLEHIATSCAKETLREAFTWWRMRAWVEACERVRRDRGGVLRERPV